MAPSMNLRFLDGHKLTSGHGGLRLANIVSRCADGYLKGDEPVTPINLTPEGRVDFHLPYVWMACTITRLVSRGRREGERLTMDLDTLNFEKDGTIRCGGAGQPITARVDAIVGNFQACAFAKAAASHVPFVCNCNE